MLPAASRLRRRPEFSLAVRQGRRAARGSVVVHLLTPVRSVAAPSRVGFIISRGVGNAVVRNRVRRRLRHLMQDRLRRLPAGSRLVLRAAPSAAGRSFSELAADLDRALLRVTR
ncbi:MAG: ribonuclease P protein component [Mycobacteriales bacterium]